MSSSKIEQQIDAIEDYIDNCKFQAFSKTNIIVDKDELDELLEELRNRTPEEIKSYRRIIATISESSTICWDWEVASPIRSSAFLRASSMMFSLLAMILR